MKRDRRLLAWWFVAYTALAIAVTFPLVLRLSSVITDSTADPLLSTSLLWWNAHVLPLTERWWNGFAFFPSTGTLAFSDHRLGESLLASPLQWLGLSPVAAYNVTLLATFPLCALSAHVLAFVLTRRHDSAAICGLAYGFNPYRVAHMSHIELLAAFGMPLALAALHTAFRTGQRRWLIAFGLATLVQGLCTSYYVAFFAVLLLLWGLWFVRRDDIRLLPYATAAGALAALALAPLAIGYAHIHAQYGMSRNIGEITAFSADVTSLVTATGHSALWGWTASLNGREGQIFPGFWITAIVFGGVAIAIRGRRIATRTNWTSVGFGLLALAYLVAACFVRPFFKPVSVGVAAAVIALGASARARDAWRRRSPLAFYVSATAAMFLCSFGPRPTFLGERVLYEPPYAWLMRLPIFSTEVRAPARFAMLAILTLSVAGALAWERLRPRARGQRLAAALLMAAIAADGCIRGLPLPELPRALPAARVAGFDAVMELPLGDTDSMAMYRATLHGRPIVNGDSGYFPPAYAAMVGAVRERDRTVLDAIPARVVVAVDKQTPAGGFWDAALREHPRAEPVSEEDAWAFFTIAPPAVEPPCSDNTLPIEGVSDAAGAVDARIFSDGNDNTRWFRDGQQAGDGILLDMGRPTHPCALMVSLGRFAFAFPRRLSVATSVDRENWRTAFEGSTAAATIRAVLATPREAWLPFDLTGSEARFIRIRLEATEPDIPWQVTELVVRGR